MHAVESVARRHQTPWQDCSIPFCLLFHLFFLISRLSPHAPVINVSLGFAILFSWLWRCILLV